MMSSSKGFEFPQILGFANTDQEKEAGQHTCKYNYFHGTFFLKLNQFFYQGWCPSIWPLLLLQLLVAALIVAVVVDKTPTVCQQNRWRPDRWCGLVWRGGSQGRLGLAGQFLPSLNYRSPEGGAARLLTSQNLSILAPLSLVIIALSHVRWCSLFIIIAARQTHLIRSCVFVSKSPKCFDPISAHRHRTPHTRPLFIHNNGGSSFCFPADAKSRLRLATVSTRRHEEPKQHLSNIGDLYDLLQSEVNRRTILCTVSLQTHSLPVEQKPILSDI